MSKVLVSVEELQQWRELLHIYHLIRKNVPKQNWKETEKALEQIDACLEGCRREKEIEWACGYEDKPGSFAMWAGPFPTIVKALQAVPENEDRNPCIICFDVDGTDRVTHTWHCVWHRWSSVVE